MLAPPTMPTFDALVRFLREYDKLTDAERDAFAVARRKFVADLRAGKGFRAGLRVKRVQGAEDTFEMTWAPDGRAFFRYGDEIRTLFGCASVPTTSSINSSPRYSSQKARVATRR